MLKTGDIFAERFSIQGLLGSGGIHQVYLVKDLSDDCSKEMALKLIKPEYGDHPRLPMTVIWEHEILQRFRHPSIVRSYSVETYDGKPYLLLQYVPGKSLKTLIAQHYSIGIPLGLAQPMVVQLAHGIQLMHSKGLVHADIKPAHVIVDDHLSPVWIDFGIASCCASFVSVDEQVGLKHFFAVTPHYVSPERFESGKTTQLDDIFAFGLLIYELLTGLPPFGKWAPYQMQGRSIKLDSPRELSKSQWAVLQQALQLSDQDRLTDIQAFLDVF